MVTIKYMRFALLISLLVCLTPPFAGAESEHSYLGVGSCSSSNCHGSARAADSSDVLRNEFVTWLKHDRHSQAFRALYNAEAKKIGQHLGIQDPTKDRLCLDCHGLAPEDHLRGPKFYVEDGVSCEACHGPSSGWIHSHAQEGATHEKNVAAGMRDLSNLHTRVSLCADCHFGTKAVVANHRLLGSGHPRLAFELDTFESVTPRHWKVDEDYIQRKGAPAPAQGWLLTQVELSSRTLDKLALTESPLEDFSNYYCYACHHSLGEKQFMSRDYHGQPGALRLNLSNLMLLEAALQDTQPQLASQIRAAISDFHGMTTVSVASNAARKALDEVRSFATTENSALRGALFEGLRKFAASGSVMDYQMADQVTMGLATLAPPGTSMKALYAVMNTPHQFDTIRFRDAAQRLAGPQR